MKFHGRFKCFEALEPRMCLSVTAQVTNGILVVTGHAEGDVEITAVDVGEFKVTDNGSEVATLNGVTKDVRIRMDDSGGSTDDNVVVDLEGNSIRQLVVDLGGGDNSLVIKNGTINASVLYRGGSGSDSVQIAADVTVNSHVDVRLDSGDNVLLVEGTIGRTLRVVGQSGADGLTLAESSRVDRGVHAYLGNGDNHAEVAGEVGYGLDIHSGAGDDTIDILATAIVERAARVDLGHGNNLLDVMGEVQGNLVVDAGSGDDTVQLDETSVLGKDVRMRLGNGSNTAHVDGQVAGNLHVTSGNENDEFVVGDTATIGGTVTLKPGEQWGPLPRVVHPLVRIAHRFGRAFRR